MKRKECAKNAYYIMDKNVYPDNIAFIEHMLTNFIGSGYLLVENKQAQ